ncbi:MAG: ribosome biogenesis GTPase Der [Anaerolineae bacterium]|uniref:ribosome biogenesis GTPase Der n=1 Tax=Candidatus Amarolinea dominans TaxID=3140696 RepID=UPI001D3A76BD|nr:ribosome biogenesis GTPase Der [Anaerolineae bacterium]MBK7200031.1 ribosome biogenesis GTPase Der [Anaerolineae bacterium]MBK9096369.1 ribosome biogenesis GTPase Der [Anaerolineae bacterium]MBK9231178.1 ribosome biogenesis GTPase Der [Anaerolineae bacterium]
MTKPIVALVGRPNVGKSTLFNRLVGQRLAIVEDLPGTTRDRIYAEAQWTSVPFTLVDTGGLEALTQPARPSPEQPAALATASSGYVREIREQALIAIQEANVVVFVVDSEEGITAGDRDVAEILRRVADKVVLCANKADNAERRQAAVEFWELGLGEPLAVSAIHGTGTGDLLDAIVELLPPAVEEVTDDSIRIGIVGRPNVGKSSLLNALLGHDRAIVSELPGSTRDAIDTALTYEGQTITLIDTAGIRRRGKVEVGIEKYSVLRALKAIERADVVLLLVDAVEKVTAQDTHVAGFILEEHKSAVVIVNKWDAIEKDEHTMNEYRDQMRGELRFMDYVPVIFISAKTHQRVNTVLPTALRVVQARRLRITTGELNRLLRSAVDANQPRFKGGRRLRFYFATQASINPPTFVIFVNDPELLHFSYERYLENQIRAQYPFEGTPIKLVFRGKVGADDAEV